MAAFKVRSIRRAFKFGVSVDQDLERPIWQKKFDVRSFCFTLGRLKTLVLKKVGLFSQSRSHMLLKIGTSTANQLVAVSYFDHNIGDEIVSRSRRLFKPCIR